LQGIPTEEENAVFFAGKSLDTFGQPAFFSAGNRMTIVVFEKEVSFKSLSLFSKTIVRKC